MNQVSYDLKINCDVRVCLDKDVERGKCGMKKNHRCPEGYHLP